MAKKSCKKGYYYCYTSKKCKRIPKGYHVMPTGYLMRDGEHKDEKEETNGKKKNGNGANGNGNGNGESSGGSNGGGVSEGWSAKYKRSIDCNNPKGFSQRAHCQGRKKVNEATMSPAQKRKDTMLKKKYDKSDMKQNMIDQYGKEEGTKIYFATIRKQAMKEEKKEHEDHEVSMAQSQLKKSERNIKKLRKALGTKEKNIPAWVQAKITDTEHNTDAAAGYMEEGKRDGKSAKSKGYSLRDWFKGGGWVQAGGKYDGKPCAKQPGQKTKPYCRDADDRASMSKEERNKRARKKRKEDPNPNRKGKAKNVKQESYSNWRADLEQLDEFLAGKPGDGYIGHPNLDIKNPLAKKQVKKEVLPGSRGGGAVNRVGAAIGDRNMRLNRMLNQSLELEGDLVDEGKKDACYHKVKSRYSVWPSAYASGALVKCRKVGAKNWGNKTKKEGFSNWREDMLLEGLEDKLRQMSPEQIEDLIKANKGAEEKIRKTLAKLKTATPNPQGKGAQLPNVPKSKPPTQPASTSSASYRETYRRGGSDRVSYQRRPRPSAPKVKVKPRMRGGKLGLALTAAGLAAPIVMKGIQAIKKRMEPDIGVHKYMQKEGYDLEEMASEKKIDKKLQKKIKSKDLNPSEYIKNSNMMPGSGIPKKLADDYQYSNWRDDFQATEYESVDIIKTEPLQPSQGFGSDMLDEKKRLMNKLDKISGQLRKASAMHKKQSQEVAKVSQHLCAGSVKHEEFGMGQCIFGQHAEPDENGFVSHYDVQFEHGIVENVSVEDMEVLTITEHDHYEMEGDVISEGGKKCWKGYKKAGTQKLFGKTYNRCVKAHFSDWRADMDLQEKKAKKDYDGDGKIESGSEEYLGSRDKAIKKAMGKKKNCGCGKDPCETYGKQEVKEDWQKSNRKDGVDGMSQKSVDAYKRENPGSKLQTAVTGKNPKGKDKKRRKSFCARSKGQKDMHNIDCSKTPDKKICKARKRWRC